MIKLLRNVLSLIRGLLRLGMAEKRKTILLWDLIGDNGMKSG